MILPLCTLGSYLYYGLGGKESTGNQLMETAAVTVATTMPNVLVDTSGLKSQVKLFGMNTEFPLQKQIGTKRNPSAENGLKCFRYGQIACR